eukprot:TRINITY_DN2736_c2_g1_i1.p1 TRINITY_DN2736_c2_g1~~TRINITY_DN2736_c2_g1_i1.p1  ORF type:complete len:1452 (+),score=318.59 TRINITY_DN2736_c2_g1_i1:57-4412(+)
MHEESKSTLFELLHDVLSRVSKVVKRYLLDPEDEAPSQFDQITILRRALKMSMFLFQGFVVKEEGCILRKDPTKVPAGGRGRGRKKVSEEGSMWEIESERAKAISTLISILDLDLVTIWRSTPEEEFIGLFSKVCLKMMENQVNVKSASLKKQMFSVLGIVISKYGYTSQITLSIVNSLLCKFAHVSPYLVELMETFATSYKHPQIVGEVLRQVGNLNPKDLSHDNAASKGVSSFLSDLAEKLPRVVLTSVSVVMGLLDGESYHFRNGVVQLLGQLVVKAFDENCPEPTTRDSLLKVLFERTHDVSPYTRSKVLQTWSSLAAAEAIPRKYYVSITERCVERLHDKAQKVRKHALVLLSKLLQFNPFGPQLTSRKFKKNLEKVYYSLEKEVGDVEQFLADQEGKDPEELEAKPSEYIQLLYLFKDALDFIRFLNPSIPKVIDLLGSKNVADVLESINFLTKAAQFKLSSAEDGLKQALALIWSKEEKIKEAILTAYSALYLTPREDWDDTKQTLYMANNLIQLTSGATLGHLTSLEEFVQIAVKKEKIPKRVGAMLWKIYENEPEEPDQEKQNNPQELAKREEALAKCRGALMILTMMANSDSSVITPKLNSIVSSLGARSRRDPLIAKYACIALQKLSMGISPTSESTSNSKEAAKETDTRYRSDAQTFSHVKNFLTSVSVPASDWFAGAEQAVIAIYNVCEGPDIFMGDIIKTMTSRLFPTCFPDGRYKSPRKQTSSQAASQITAVTTDGQVKASEVAKLFFLIGQVALRQLIYVEDIHKEIRRKLVAESESKKAKNSAEEEAIEKELGTALAAQQEQEEKDEKEAKDQIVSTKNLLGVFGPMITSVCYNSTGRYVDPLLRSSAVLALSKFMCVSSEFCEKHLQLLFSILESDDHPSLRANIIIALGDLNKRFPNPLKPWIDHLFKRLRDHEPRVRKNTLMVLTHLINMDMVKATQLGDMAMCLEDDEERIRKLAELFFYELSCKGQGNNTVYNIIPDTLSHLSNATIKWKSNNSDPEGLNPETFKKIMKHLFSYITNEVHIEALVGKLCARFKETTDAFLWRNIVHCLSLLTLSDKSCKKLADSFKEFKESLIDRVVHDTFLALITKVKKKVKTETKTILDELEAQMNQYRENIDEKDIEAHDQGLATQKPVEEEEEEAPVNKGRGRAGKKGGKKVVNKSTALMAKFAKRRRVADVSSEESSSSWDDGLSEGEEEEEVGRRKRKSNPKGSDSMEIEGEDGEEEHSSARVPRDDGLDDADLLDLTPTPRKQTTQKILDTQDEDEDIFDAEELDTQAFEAKKAQKRELRKQQLQKSTPKTATPKTTTQKNSKKKSESEEMSVESQESVSEKSEKSEESEEKKKTTKKNVASKQKNAKKAKKQESSDEGSEIASSKEESSKSSSESEEDSSPKKGKATRGRGRGIIEEFFRIRRGFLSQKGQSYTRKRERKG